MNHPAADGESSQAFERKPIARMVANATQKNPGYHRRANYATSVCGARQRFGHLFRQGRRSRLAGSGDV
jgi:hypothetical protein